MPFAKRHGRLALLLAGMSYATIAHPALGETGKATGIEIQHAWARATPKGADVAGGYLTIINHGTAADTLTGGSSPVSAKFEIHTMSMDGGIMHMRPNGPLVIPAGGTVTLSPEGRHVMMTGLHRGLRKGETVDATLTFEHAGTVPVRFTVEAIGARAPGAEHAMPGMKM